MSEIPQLLWRRLVRSPGFSLLAAATLALGIGATTAIFSLVHAVLLSPLPFPHPSELYGLWHSAPGIGIPKAEHTVGTYSAYRDLSRSFLELGLSGSGFSMSLTGVGEPVRVETATVTASLFHVLDAGARLGRTFTEDEDEPGAPKVALLSYELWRGRFGGDPGILGRKIVLDAEPWEVIGVMEPGFTYPGESTELWIPLAIRPEDLGGTSFNFDAVGRLKGGVSVAAATAELNAILRRVPEIYPGELTSSLLESAGLSAYMSPLKEDVVGDVAPVLWLLFGTVSFVLVIACANVANLFLVRADGRRRELALRTALGASRFALLRQFLSESLALAFLGGLVGLGLAFFAVRAIVAAGPVNVPRLGNAGLHLPVLFLAMGLSLLSGVVLGWIPVLRFRRANLSSAIQEGGPRSSEGRETHRMRGLLVVVQVALALVLLTGSGLMARSFWKLRAVDPGFEPSGWVAVQLSLPDASYPDSASAAAFYSRLLDTVRALPGVERAGAAAYLPMGHDESHNGLVFEDFPVNEGELPPVLATNWAMPGYFETMGIPLLEGRTFERRDHAQRTGAVVVSRSLEERYWPGGSALGKRLAPGLPREGAPWYEIVGVVGDVRQQGLEKELEPMVYYPVIGLGGDPGSWAIRTQNVVVKSHLPPEPLSRAIRETVWSLDRSLPIMNVRTGNDLVFESMARTTYTMFLLAIASSVALFLGTIGIYGVLSYIVGLRTREIGVRMALGAERRDVSRMVLRQGFAMTLTGVGVGVLAALAATRMMGALLFGVSGWDPATLVAVTLFLLSVTALASYLPAHRAAGTDPLTALRME